jgi:hypothetical protein
VIALLGISYLGLVFLAMGTGTADAVFGAKACEIGMSAKDTVRLIGCGRQTTWAFKSN